MRQNQLSPNPGAKKSVRRLGRGFTRGKTCGRGHKGYKSRSGSSVPAAFEGGQMPLQRRLPKCGFHYVHSKRNHLSLTMRNLCAALVKSDISEKELHLTLDFLREIRLIKRHIQSVKLLASDNVQLPAAISSLVLGESITASKSLDAVVKAEAKA